MCNIGVSFMAIYHCSVSPIRRSAGRSATAAAAYRAGVVIADERTGELHDYTRRGGVMHADVLTPDNAPAWMADRQRLWNAAEAAEKRKDACVGREIEVSLPHELDASARLGLAREFAADLVDRYGVAVDMCLHAPHRQGDQRNYHVHYLLTTRAAEPQGLASRKSDLELSDRDRKKNGLPTRKIELHQIRERWAAHVNRALERAGQTERVDHRSYEERGIDKGATRHLGPKATKMERAGHPSRIGDENRQVEVWNRELYETKWQLSLVEAAIKAEKARLEDQQQRRGAKGRTERAGGSQAPSLSPARLEEWANQRRATLQSRHIDEQRELSARHDQQKARQEEDLKRFYGPGQARAREVLRQIEEQRKKAWTKRQREEAVRQAEAQRKTLADVSARWQEQRASQQAQRSRELEALYERQAQERGADERTIAQAMERGAIPSNDNRGADGTERGSSRGPGRERGRDGP